MSVYCPFAPILALQGTRVAERDLHTLSRGKRGVQSAHAMSREKAGRDSHDKGMWATEAMRYLRDAAASAIFRRDWEWETWNAQPLPWVLLVKGAGDRTRHNLEWALLHIGSETSVGSHGRRDGARRPRQSYSPRCWI